MGLIEPEVEEEGFIGVAFLVQPGKGFVHDDLAGVAFHGTDTSAVAQKVGGIFVTGMSPIDQAEPVIETMIGRGRISAPVDRHAQMPLAKVSRSVAFSLKYFGESRFTPQQMHSVTLFTEDGIDSSADVVAASKESGS